MSDGDIKDLGGNTIKSRTVSRYELLRQLADAYDNLATLEGLPDEDALWEQVDEARFLLGENAPVSAGSGTEEAR